MTNDFTPIEILRPTILEFGVDPDLTMTVPKEITAATGVEETSMRSMWLGVASAILPANAQDESTPK
ncbi:hypothetical protein [Bradyrhizobium monzae]|uniref:hypothetical protein n=1 Tax=Bradyrhizobium sp. Oc8 TaxID=2876780 RepID=UPI001F204156|nr:hypothetical protein [Bradyrhizobium sp. Oc8]